MRLLVETDDSAVVEVGEVLCVPADADILVFHSSVHLKSGDLARLEESLTKKTMKRCVILPPMLILEPYDRPTSETGQ